MSGTVWIDLTDITYWNGQHGGTQRVVYGIAEEYYQQSLSGELDVRFFAFNEAKRQFVVTDFEPIRSRAQAVAVSVDGHDQVEERSRKEKLKHYAVEYSPRLIRSNDRVRHTLFKGAKIAYIQLGNAKKVVKKIKYSAQPKSITGASAIFRKDDTVLILGKPWDFPTMTPALAELKSHTDFKLAVLIYDLIIPLFPHLHSPKLFKTYTQYMFEAIQAADILLPISKSTDRDITKFCKQLMLPRPKSQVIRLGDALESVAEPKKPNYIIQKDFLLCVGTIEIRKNHALLYYVYKRAQEKGIKLPQLIVVGRPGWLASDVRHLLKKDQSLADKVTVIESASDRELAWLYANCLFSVYPSMYEGWGLPVAESLQYGKYVVASSASSIPEIAGDLLEYFSPYSVDGCLESITKFLDKKTLLQGEERIQKTYITTSWYDTAQQVQDALKKL